MSTENQKDGAPEKTGGSSKPPFTGPRLAWSLMFGAAGGAAIFLLLGVKPWDLHMEELLAGGERPPLDAFIAEGMWKAAAVNLVFLLLLLSTAKWWLSPLPFRLAERLYIRPGKMFWIAMIGLVGFSAWFRLPRLSHDLWNDEEYTLRRYAWGYAQEVEGGDIAFKQVSWKTTLWDDRGANNHIPFSVAARLSLSAWRAANPHAAQPFSEAALRLPAYLAGLGAILFLGWAVAVRGSPIAGFLAAAVLAFHPWFLRYSVEARGYAFLIFFGLIAAHFLQRALADLRWRNFLWFGLFQFLALYSFPGAVYLAFVWNVIAGLGLLLRLGWKAGLRGVARLAVCSIISAMTFLQLMGPCLRQIRLYLERDIARAQMGTEWWLDLWSHLAAGLRWSIDDPGNPLAVSGYLMATEEPLFRFTALFLLPVLIAFGLARSALDREIPGMFVWPPFLAIPIAFAHTAFRGNFLFAWYVIYAVPAIAVAVSAAIAGLAKFWPEGTTRKVAEITIGVGFVGLLVAGSWASATALRDHPRQQLHGVIAQAYEGADPYGAPAASLVVASVGTSSSQLRSYAPHLVVLDSRDEKENTAGLKALIAAAKRGGGRLRVICGGLDKARKTQPDITELLESDAFVEAGRANGLEELFSFRIYDYQPAAASDAEAKPRKRRSSRKKTTPASTEKADEIPPQDREATRTD